MGNSILYLEDVTVSFDGVKVIDGLNSCIDYGELRFLIGPNGAGKSTLLNVICGQVRPVTGQVFFKENIDIEKLSEYKIAQLGIGRKFQTPSVFTNLTVYENLELALTKNKGIFSFLFNNSSVAQNEKIVALLEQVGLPGQADKKAGFLSHGQKQWLEIGMILIQEPELVLLDEPVAGMTKEETAKTGELLKEIAKKQTVVVVEHDMEFVREFAGKVTVMHEGKILCEGPMERVQKDPRVIEVYLGR